MGMGAGADEEVVHDVWAEMEGELRDGFRDGRQLGSSF